MNNNYFKGSYMDYIRPVHNNKPSPLNRERETHYCGNCTDSRMSNGNQKIRKGMRWCKCKNTFVGERQVCKCHSALREGQDDEQ